MVTAVLSDEGQGLKIPQGMAGLSAMFAVAVASCLFAAIVLQGVSVGSVIALAYALPMGWLIWQARIDLLKVPSKRACVVFMAACLSSLAYAPGLLNVLLGGVLLLTGAVVLRSEAAAEPLQIAGASFRQFAGGIGRAVLDGASCLAAILHIPARSFPKVTIFVLPVMAGIVFAALLASANPVLEQLVKTLDLNALARMVEEFFNAATSPTALWFILFFAFLWPTLRGNAVPRISTDNGSIPSWHQSFFRPAAVIATLLLLNVMFAGQNLMDISFIWSDAKLPDGMSHAEYVHRGSYTLIATSLLAASLMMFILRKGSATEQSRSVQLLVHLWTVQNLLLVASSAKRTLSYIADYGWTEWRIAGLIWMALVFFGLATIILRVIGQRDTRWLLNLNLTASMIVLLVTSAWNMQGFIAEMNVDRSAAKQSIALDSEYLADLGPAALPALVRAYENSRLQPEGYAGGYYSFSDFYIKRLEWTLISRQSDWRSWTFANAMISLPEARKSEMNRE
jgi:hypothetical protein